MNARRFRKMIKKYQENSLPEQDRHLVDAWMDHLSKDEPREQMWSEAEIEQLHSRIVNNFTKDSNVVKKLPSRKRWIYSGIAAAMVLLIGIYFIRYFSQQEALSTLEIQAVEVLPATESPTLTLESGETIVLNKGKKHLKVGSDQLSYADGTVLLPIPLQDAPPASMSLHVPKGCNYQIELEDGTMVYLNAYTTLRYPRHFDGPSRTVQLEGEAYFEVSHQTYRDKNGMQKRRPFMVVSRDQQVEVLGTRFNVEAYKDAPNTKTTLLQGQVAVQNMVGSRRLLSPAQQSLVTPGISSIQLQHMDEDAVLDWKNRLFVFHNASLQQIMDEVSRWYDIHVDIKHWPSDRFYGEIRRDAPLSEILDMIQHSSNLRFKIINQKQERRLIML